METKIDHQDYTKNRPLTKDELITLLISLYNLKDKLETLIYQIKEICHHS